MNSSTQINYDELNTIVKDFKGEGEDMTVLYATTRQRVHDLYKEWIGQGAEAFFDEMENELLPALERVARALFTAQDTLNQVMKTIHSADEETTGYFKGDFQGDASAHADFGAHEFEKAGEAAQTGSVQNIGSGIGAPAGVSAFNIDEQKAQEGASTTPVTQSAETGGGGGGGGGGAGGQGMQGDLKQMGVGLVDQTPQSATVGSSAVGAQDLPDHLFGGGSGGGNAPQTPPAGAGAGSSGEQPPAPESGGDVVAGIAGVAGSAAIGGAAKIIKENKEQSG